MMQHWDPAGYQTHPGTELLRHPRAGGTAPYRIAPDPGTLCCLPVPPLDEDGAIGPCDDARLDLRTGGPIVPSPLRGAGSVIIEWIE
jgi:hypothetical protein